MEIVYPCGCKAVIYARSSNDYNYIINEKLEPLPFLHLCNDHRAEFIIRNREVNRNIGLGV